MEIDAPAVAGTSVLTLPTGTGTLLTAEGGKILQIVRATSSIITENTTTSFTDVPGMSITITPQKSNSSVLIIFNFLGHVIATSGSPVGVYQITDSSNNAISGANALYYGNTGYTSSFPNNWAPITLIAYAQPATTSATTYKLRFRKDGTSSEFAVRTRGDISVSQMYAIEVSA